MFRVVNPETITVTVRVEPPGQPADQFSLTLRYLGVKGRQDILARARQATESGKEAEDAADDALLAELVCGWGGLEDMDGSILEFSQANLKRLLDIPYLRRCIVKAVVEELMLGGADSKNLWAPPGTGREAVH